MSLLVAHAKNELALLGPEDEMQQAMNAHILRMVETFANEGHSGFSAAYAVAILEKLLRYEPLTPLTGDDSEWRDVSSACGGSKCWQNKRCSHVFKDETGTYDSEGRIFCEPSGACYHSLGSRVYITFPYTPKREYVDVGEVS